MSKPTSTTSTSTTSTSPSSSITLAQQAAWFETHYVPTAQKACDFLTSSTDPYHAVRNGMTQLQAAGFTALDTSLPFAQQGGLKPGGKYYYHVHHSALVAFCIGGSIHVVPTAATTTTTTAPSLQPQPSLVPPLVEPFGFHIIGGHTDSPNLKLKPRSKKTVTGGAAVKQLGVQCYGGGLWHTWLDRDLSLSGKVLIRQQRRMKKVEGSGTTTTTTTSTTSTVLEPRLIQLHQPIARVSSLAIHLETAEERTRLLTNKETHTVPVIATDPYPIPYLSKVLLEQGMEQQLNAAAITTTTIGSSSSSSRNESEDDDDEYDPYAWKNSQEPYLLQLIATRLGLDNVNDIVDWDLSFYDTQPATLGGMCREFLHSARLDNLATVFCGLTSIIEYATATTTGSTSSTTTTTTTTALQESKDVSMVVFFDHEEVGSESAEGAGSPIITNAIQRIATALVVQSQQESSSSTNATTTTVSPDWLTACLEKSFILSIDMAHAIHPNFAQKHDAQHAPQLNGGIVVKTNCNQRYTTSGSSNSGFLLRELAARRGRPNRNSSSSSVSVSSRIPMQEFVVKNDCACGTTIGPVLSAKTGIRTVDAGMPQWSMHSCREVMGIADCTLRSIDIIAIYFLVSLECLFFLGHALWTLFRVVYFFGQFFSQPTLFFLYPLFISLVTHCLNLFQEFFTSFRALDDSLKKELS
jgi:aspartyl aminopeptidase